MPEEQIVLVSESEQAACTCEGACNCDSVVPLCSQQSEFNSIASSQSADSLNNISAQPEKKLLKHNRLLLELRNKKRFCLARFATKDFDIKYYTGFKS